MGTIGAGVFSGIAALGAVWAAWSSSRQANRSTQAAIDALEALGRQLRPDLLLWTSAYDDPSNHPLPKVQWPAPLKVRIYNRSGFTAENVVVDFAHADGRTRYTLGPVAVGAESSKELAIERFSPAHLESALDLSRTSVGRTQWEAVHTATIAFSDVREALRWEQTWTVHEAASVQPHGPSDPNSAHPWGPVWVFNAWVQGPPVLVRRPR